VISFKKYLEDLSFKAEAVKC